MLHQLTLYLTYLKWCNYHPTHLCLCLSNILTTMSDNAEGANLQHTD